MKNYHIQNQTLTATPHASPDPDLWYRASEWIIAENSTVKNGADVRFTAGNEITLLPGFTVEAGANFEAYIQSCATQKTDFQPISENSNEMLEDSIETTEPLPKPTNSASLSIYPNPFGSELNITSDTELQEIWLTDIYGRKIIEKLAEERSQSYTLKTNSLAAGCYVLHIRSIEGLSVHKVCKE